MGPTRANLPALPIVAFAFLDQAVGALPHLRSNGEHPWNGLREYFGIFRVGSCKS